MVDSTEVLGYWWWWFVVCNGIIITIITHSSPCKEIKNYKHWKHSLLLVRGKMCSEVEWRLPFYFKLCIWSTFSWFLLYTTTTSLLHIVMIWSSSSSGKKKTVVQSSEMLSRCESLWIKYTFIEMRWGRKERCSKG